MKFPENFVRNNTGSTGYTLSMQRTHLIISAMFLCAFVFGVTILGWHTPVSNNISLLTQVKDPFTKAKEEQIFFCDHVLPFILDKVQREFKWVEPIKATNATFGMYVYSHSDYVSHDIAMLGTWDEPKLKKFIKWLKIYADTQNLTREQVYFIDVGANVGWFTFALASLGYSVISFEPLLDNEIMMRSTLCANPSLMSRITFFNKGLGATPQKCVIYSDSVNIGDGHTQCNGNLTLNTSLYKFRSNIEVVRMDDIFEGKTEILNRIGLVKIDTEGFEPQVFAGGRRTLLDSGIPMMCVELFQSSRETTFTILKEKYRVFRSSDLKSELKEWKNITSRIFDVIAVNDEYFHKNFNWPLANGSRS